jgi:hypothetical protein
MAESHLRIQAVVERHVVRVVRFEDFSTSLLGFHPHTYSLFRLFILVPVSPFSLTVVIVAFRIRRQEYNKTVPYFNNKVANFEYAL